MAIEMNTENINVSEGTVTLAAAAMVVANFALYSTRLATGSMATEGGNLLLANIVEERVLSNLQNRIIRAGDNNAK